MLCGKARRGRRFVAATSLAVLLTTLSPLVTSRAGAATLGSLIPVSGSPATLLTVTGSGFASAGQLQANFAGELVPVTVVSDAMITFSVPADAKAGRATVMIDQGGTALQPSFSVTVLLLSSPPVAEAGASYTASLVVTGGTPPYAFSVASGELAAGLSLSTAGVVSGTAKTVGSSSCVVTVTDASRLSASFTLQQVVVAGPSVTTATLGSATLGSNYAVSLSAAGGAPPYAWSIGSGAIPGGLVLSSSGLLSGRPGQSGQYSVAVKVTDALGSSSTRRLALVVAAPIPQAALLFATAGGVAETESTVSHAATTATAGSSIVAALASGDGTKMWLASSSGRVTTIGTSPLLGELAHPRKNPIVAAAAKKDGSGYWLVSSSGHVYGFGSARNKGSLSAKARGRAVGIAAVGSGYFLVTAKGEVVGFGGLRSFGSVRPSRLRGRIVGIAATADGKGYWLVASTGVVYAFGSARAAHLGAPARFLAPVVGIAAAPTGKGYWLVGASGVVASFGSAVSLGAATGLGGAAVVAIASAS